jgi:hypothetical protein
MFRDRFTAAEWQTVMYTPLWAFSGVAGIDGKVDDAEAAVLTKELSEALLYKDEFTREVFGAIMANLPVIGPAYQADARSPIQGLQEAALLFDAKLPGGGADHLKLATLGICIAAAKASGPRFREKISKEEGTAIALVASVLRVPVPVG